MHPRTQRLLLTCNDPFPLSVASDDGIPARILPRPLQKKSKAGPLFLEDDGSEQLEHLSTRAQSAGSEQPEHLSTRAQSAGSEQPEHLSTRAQSASEYVKFTTRHLS